MSRAAPCAYDRAGYGFSDDPGTMPRTSAQIAAELHTALLNANIPGLYLLVAHSFGGYNMRAFADLTTVFRIASMSKSFTVLALLKLRDQGKLSLDDPVAKWIPEFARVELPTSDFAPVKIRQLLSHSAGFPEDNPWGDQQLSASDAAVTQWLRKGIPFSTPPGTRFEYSNLAFGLLGRVVTEVSGVPYARYVEREILGKLHMAFATFEFSEVPKGMAPRLWRRPLCDGIAHLRSSL